MHGLLLFLPSTGLLAGAPVRTCIARVPGHAGTTPSMLLDVALQDPQALAAGAVAAGGIGGVAFTRKRRAGQAGYKQVEKETEEKKELDLSEMLRQYGVFALLFHFSVWITSLALVYSALSLGGDVDLSMIPFLPTTDATAGAGVLGRVAVTLGVVEAIGPARLALTIAATPAVSERARRIESVREAEQRVVELGEKLLQRLPGAR